jgi:hypothetical protein
MKNHLIIPSLLLAGAVSAYSQGQIYFADYQNRFSVTIWSPQSATATNELTGNGPGDAPAGSQSGYTGVPIGGSNVGTGPTAYANGADYSVALYQASGANQPWSSLTPVGTPLTMSTIAGFAGLWVTTEAPTFPETPGTVVTLGLAVWYNGGGGITFDQASVAGSGDPYGESPTGNVMLGGGTIPVSDLPGGANGIQSFSLIANPMPVIPEPNTIALGTVGASAFLLRLRCKVRSRH